ncbi:Dam family site-specific DNA-(adenine-N6)-methyltransferase [Klebsiella pneumoniae subsp. pneumoniae]|nr:Dam family site-specific DNA-(adenine-N6)-methyltransferase [Klebsiella pneumoniae subsp. pneumoniae]
MLDRALCGRRVGISNTDFSRYILADINSDLIGLYNIVKLRTDEYVAAAREMFTPENNVAERYYLYRDEFNQSQDPLRRAVLFLYLNRHGYNGLCRYNLRGEFNVPFGRYKKPYFPEAELLSFRREGAKRRVLLRILRRVHATCG